MAVWLLPSCASTNDVPIPGKIKTDGLQDKEFVMGPPGFEPGTFRSPLGANALVSVERSSQAELWAPELSSCREPFINLFVNNALCLRAINASP